MKDYTVRELARLSGVSVRALHHYDAIGLLKPAFVGENRYRYYGREELLRLQQILLHRELGLPLAEIATALEEGGRNRVALLEQQRERLRERIDQSRQLIRTIDRTIAELKGQRTMNGADLYRGFTPQKQTEYEEWLVGNYGDQAAELIAEGKANLATVSKDRMAELKAEGNAATDALAEAFRAGRDAGDATNRPLLDRHRAWVSAMWGRVCPPNAYARLGDLYLAHPGFRENFDRLGDGFTDWLVSAMKTHGEQLAASGE